VSGVVAFLARGPFDAPDKDISWGVTFSQPYAEELGLDWRKAYTEILDDLGVRALRLSAYWSLIEQEQGVFDFTDLDWQIVEAKKRNAKILLSVGRRLPRWPECHIPEWSRKQGEQEQQASVLEYLKTVVSQYKHEDAIVAWQVENEPFVEFFGKCPEADEEFFASEIRLVRSLDDFRPIIVSDSGELSTWLTAAKYGDVLGITMYRIVPKIIPELGYTTYPLPPWFYRKKANLVNRFVTIEKLIVVELQAEPWAGKDFIADTPVPKQYRSMNPQQFRENIQYAKEAGISEVYLWGAEWWYWMKEIKGDATIWEEARKLWEP